MFRVFEGLFMGMPPGFEIFSYTYVYVWVRARSGGFVNNVSSVAMAFEWAFFSFRFLAIALFVCLTLPPLVFLEHLFVVCLYNLFDIGQVAQTIKIIHLTRTGT